MKRTVLVGHSACARASAGTIAGAASAADNKLRLCMAFPRFR
jgi:hypothetical protein